MYSFNGFANCNEHAFNKYTHVYKRISEKLGFFLFIEAPNGNNDFILKFKQSNKTFTISLLTTAIDFFDSQRDFVICYNVMQNLLRVRNITYNSDSIQNFTILTAHINKLRNSEEHSLLQEISVKVKRENIIKELTEIKTLLPFNREECIAKNIEIHPYVDLFLETAEVLGLITIEEE